MILTKEEEIILKGKKGPGYQRALEFLVKTGEVFGAKRLRPIEYAHIIMEEAQKFGEEAKAGEKIVQSFTEGVKSFAVPTTLNPLLLNLRDREKIGIPDSVFDRIFEQVSKAKEFYLGLGAIPAYSCTPHYFYPLKMGKHIAVTEGEVVVFSNSVLGLRTHYETPVSALAAAIIGKVPEFGLHLKPYRCGEVLVKVNMSCEDFSYADYGALALWVAEKIGNKIPIWDGLPKDMTETQLKYFSMGHCLGGTPGLFHILGVTPEVFAEDTVFGIKKVNEAIIVGKRELHEAYEKCTTADKKSIDAVLIGCPHCGLEELRKIACLLDGKKVNSGVRLWIATNRVVKDLALRMKFIEVIEKAGGLVLEDMCVGIALLSHFNLQLGVQTVVTNSVCPALFIPPLSLQKIGVYYLKLEDCITASIRGTV